MAKQHLILALVTSGAAMIAACSSTDVKVGPGTGNEAGAAGDSGEPGASGDTGTSGGTAVSLNPQGVIVPADAPTKFAHVLAAGTDYMKTEISSVALDTGKIDAAAQYADGDAIAVSSAGLGFAIERTNDRAYLLDAGTVKKTFNLRSPGTDTTPISNKAYVPFLNQSKIAILDLDAGFVSRRIDLSQFDIPGDGDKSVDAAEGIYDAASKRVYFVLQRIDRSTIVMPDYQLACTDAKGLLIAIDSATDEIVDLNGPSSGKGIELSLVDQNSLSLNADGSTLYMLASGCYEAGVLQKQGVEVVDLTDGTTTVAYAPDTTDFLAKLMLTTGSEALLGSIDSAGTTHWNRLDLVSGKLVGKELKNVPQAPIYDGKDLLGVKTSASEYGVLVRYDLSTGTVAEISDPLWAGKYGTAAATALVQ